MRTPLTRLLLNQILPSLALLLPSSAAWADPGFLHTHGQDIVDANNRKVMLRGVGLGNWLLPEGYMWHFGGAADRPRKIEALVSDLAGPEYAAKFWADFRANYISEKDIARIAELGFNSVRIPLNARLFLTEGDDPQFNEEGFQLLDNLVTWCRKDHLWLVIDMHAAPGGQTGQNIDDSTNDDPQLFADPAKYEPRLTKLWLRIVEKYKDDPTVIAYDLLNEPIPERTGAAARHKDQLEPLYKRLATAIRAIDKNHMLTVEGFNWANNWSCFTAPPFDDNLVYQFHYYCWDKPTNLKGIDGYLAHRDRLNAPVWVGETGEKENTIYWGTTDYFEHNNIGWCFWPWKKMDTTNTPYSVTAPAHWDQITNQSRPNTNTPKPAQETAQAIFTEYLHNIRLENCTYIPEVVNALFHRLPAKIEAENYTHLGQGKSWAVTQPTTQSTLYRKSEPVPIVATDRNGQAIQLVPTEWTAYEANATAQSTYSVTLRIKPTHTPATVHLTVNDSEHSANIAADGWSEVQLNPINFKPGPNTLKLSVDAPADIDWIDVR